MQDAISRAIEQASSFMTVGEELKHFGIKYNFSFEPVPNYTITGAGNLYTICASIYADDSAVKVTDLISMEITKL